MSASNRNRPLSGIPNANLSSAIQLANMCMLSGQFLHSFAKSIKFFRRLDSIIECYSSKESWHALDILQFIHHECYHDAVITQSLEDHSYNSFGKRSLEQWEMLNSSMTHTYSHLESILKYSENMEPNRWKTCDCKAEWWCLSLGMLYEWAREAGKWKRPWERVTTLWVMKEKKWK